MKFQKMGQFEVSELIYGMWRINESGITTDELILLLEELSKLKINAIDTAAIYGGEYHLAEKRLGQAIKLDPTILERFTIISKCGIECRSKVNHYDNSYDYILNQVNSSLESLNITKLDILLLHRPDIFMDFEQVYQAFNYLKTNNLVSEFGVSNYTPIQFAALKTYLEKRNINLVTNQIEINTYTSEHFDNDNVFYLKGQEISPMIWSPMAGGALFKDNEIANVINIIAKDNELTNDQVVISYLTSQGLNPIIILGSHKIERFKSALVGVEKHLTHHEMYTILKGLTKKDVR